MKKQQNALANEQGFVLITSLLMLVVLMIIGIAATNTTTTELQISGNDKLSKETFYGADGGVQMFSRLVEESIAAPGGFTQLDANKLLQDPVNPNDTILVVDSNLAENADLTRDESSLSDANRDIAYFPGGYDATNAAPHTNAIVDGLTSITAGAGSQMLAGYEGKGKGTAGGGGQILYTIYSQHSGQGRSQSTIEAKWRHQIGLELDNRY